MLIEIHILQNHAPSNLNRDDTGSPKECVFGAVRRGRISSQCLKRSIRRSDLFQKDKELAKHLATRTRRLPELMRKRFQEETLGEYAEIAAQKATGFGTDKGTERDPNKKTGEYETAQTMFLTEDDKQAVFSVLLAAAREAGSVAKFQKIAAKDMQAKARQIGFRPMTVDIALFGRMITSEAFRNVEASAQVAHALSTHKVEHEFDYFTAVDDIPRANEEREEDAGADMLGDVEFNSACYYKYFSIHTEGLIDNLTGVKLGRKIPAEEQAAAVELAAITIEALLKAAVCVTPTGKQNSFAAHQLPATVLVEVRPDCTPVSYANAFVDPARNGKDGDLVRASFMKLARHVEALTKGFNLIASPRLILAPEFPDPRDPKDAEKTHPLISGVERVNDLASLCNRLKEVVRNGNTHSSVTA
jgi:CRISPR system Cascade subunit CasC